MSAAEQSVVTDERIRSMIDADRKAIERGRQDRRRQRERLEETKRALDQALDDLRAATRRLERG